jgi:hypothetical protein
MDYSVEEWQKAKGSKASEIPVVDEIGLAGMLADRFEGKTFGEDYRFKDVVAALRPYLRHPVTEQPIGIRGELIDNLDAAIKAADGRGRLSMEMVDAIWRARNILAGVVPLPDELKAPEREAVSRKELDRIKAEMMAIYEDTQYAPLFRIGMSHAIAFIENLLGENHNPDDNTKQRAAKG